MRPRAIRSVASPDAQRMWHPLQSTCLKERELQYLDDPLSRGLSRHVLDEDALPTH